MPKKRPTKRQKDPVQLARHILDTIAPDAEPKRTKPPRPTKRQDAQDIDRADSEGMGQRHQYPRKKSPKKKATAKRKKG